MFTHEQMLNTINAGLKVLGRAPLDGIPVAAPGHYKKCVLGCSYEASLMDEGQFGVIDLHPCTAEEARLVAAAWRDTGAECVQSHGAKVRFWGGMYEWMVAFDGGRWEQLIVPIYNPDNCSWSGETDPGDYTLDPAELEPASDEDFVAAREASAEKHGV